MPRKKKTNHAHALEYITSYKRIIACGAVRCCADRARPAPPPPRPVPYLRTMGVSSLHSFLKSSRTCALAAAPGSLAASAAASAAASPPSPPAGAGAAALGLGGSSSTSSAYVDGARQHADIRAVNHSLSVSLERRGTKWSMSCSGDRQRATVWIDSNAFSRTFRVFLTKFGS